MMKGSLENPDLQAKLDHWVNTTGRAANELVEDAMSGYFDELTRVRAQLDQRYADAKSGKVQLLDGDEASDRLRQKTAERRSRPE